MLVLIVILILLVISVVAAILIPRFFMIEKVEVDEQPELDFPPDDGETPEAEFDDSLSLKEKMELGGYFDGEQDAEPPGGAPEGETGDGGVNNGDDEELVEERFAEVDRLTSLKSGRGFLLDCQRALNQAKAQDEVYACAYFDFDRFRFINSLKGLITGDYVLTRASQELENVFPPDSLITRLSADHFAALFPVPDSTIYGKLDELMKQMCEKIRSDMAIKGALRLRVGVAFTDIEADYDIRMLIHKANIARHCIKTSRDETYHLYDDTMLSTYLFGESALEDYSENQYDEEFALYFTPIEDVSLHALYACEALVRWTCEDEVDRTLPSSIHKCMIPSNSQKVVYQACKALSRWRKAGKQPLPVLISLPPTEFFKADIDEFLIKVLSEFQLEPEYLCVVVDAALARLDWSTVSRQMKRISDAGIRVGVDEIDTGYRDLNFLGEMPVSFLKLHRSFTRGLMDEDGSAAEGRLVHMLNLAKAGDRTVYLEGVDSQELAERVGELGVRVIQGAFAGRPQKSEEFSQGLAAYVERKNSKDTVILDSAALHHGEYNVF